MSIHRWLTGFFLLLLMLVVLGAGSWIFAARSFQEHFAQVSGGEGVFSTQAIVSTQQAIAGLEARSAPAQMRLDGLEHQLQDVQAVGDKLVAQQKAGASALSAKLQPLEVKAQIDKSAVHDDSYVGVGARVARLQQMASIDQSELRPLLADLNQLTGLNQQIIAQEDSAKQIEADISTLQVQMNNDRQALIQSAGSFANHFDQIVSEIEALKKSSPLGWGEYLAEIHPAFLSALLVMCMGALGSLLFLFPAYIANRPGMTVTFDTIIVRTVFGMVVAFAFAIVYHLGLALASATGGSASTIDQIQSPFVIAGLGIVAGVMGDDIAKWIHDRGAYLFKTGAGGSTFADIARSAVAGAAARPVAPVKSDLPSGGLANPHGGPGDPS